MIEQTIQRIDQSLVAFLEKSKKDYNFAALHPLLFESIKDFCTRKGKRIRPLLMVLSYLAFTRKAQPNLRRLYTASACLELLHNFMLIHDDIIDCSALRRGKPTLHKILAKTITTPQKEKLGTDLAIVAGDIVYALAIDAFLTIDEEPRRKEEALRYFIQTAAFTAMGEFIDILQGYQKTREIQEKDVLLNYTLKTARYTFACPLVIGAILAGAKKTDIAKLSSVGIMLGQAFQVQDDIIGVFSTQKEIGKSVLSDIEEYKKTILVCHAFRTLKSKEKKAFMSVFLKPKKDYHDLVLIRQMFIRSGSLKYSLKKVAELLTKSQKIIAAMNINARYKATIQEALSKPFRQSREIAEHFNI